MNSFLREGGGGRMLGGCRGLPSDPGTPILPTSSPQVPHPQITAATAASNLLSTNHQPTFSRSFIVLFFIWDFQTYTTLSHGSMPDQKFLVYIAAKEHRWKAFLKISISNHYSIPVFHSVFLYTCVSWVWVWSQQRGKTSDKHAGSLVFQLRDAHWTIEHALVLYSCTWHSIEHPYLFMMKHVEVQLGKMRSKSYSSRTICVSKFISFVGFKLLFSQVLQPNPRDHPGGPGTHSHGPNLVAVLPVDAGWLLVGCWLVVSFIWSQS